MSRSGLCLRACGAAALTAAAALSLSGCAGGDPQPFTLAVTELEPGQCFDLAADEAFALVKPDCSWQHDHEVFAMKELDGASFPGDDAVTDAANDFCTTEYIARAAASPSENGRYSIEFFGPSAKGWAEGDRAVLCSMVSAGGQPSTGSAFAGLGGAAASPTP